MPCPARRRHCRKTRRRGFRLRLAALVIGLVVLSLPALAAATSSRLTGRVLDSDSQAPITNADVELSNTSGGQGYFRAHTNARGRQPFASLP